MSNDGQDKRKFVQMAPDVAERIEAAGKAERRSFANMTEVLVLEALDARHAQTPSSDPSVADEADPSACSGTPDAEAAR